MAVWSRVLTRHVARLLHPSEWGGAVSGAEVGVRVRPQVCGGSSGEDGERAWQRYAPLRAVDAAHVQHCLLLALVDVNDVVCQRKLSRVLGGTQADPRDEVLAEPRRSDRLDDVHLPAVDSRLTAPRRGLIKALSHLAESSPWLRGAPQGLGRPQKASCKTMEGPQGSWKTI